MSLKTSHILTVGIGIITFLVNIISELDFSIILQLFLLYIFCKVNTSIFSLVDLFMNSQLSVLA